MPQVAEHGLHFDHVCLQLAAGTDPSVVGDIVGVGGIVGEDVGTLVGIIVGAFSKQ